LTDQRALRKDSIMHLDELGWDPAWSYHVEEFGEPNLVPGRLAAVDRGRVVALTESGVVAAKWRFPVAVVGEAEGVVPAVGDWGMLRPTANPGALAAVLPRRTLLARGKAEGARAIQPLVANVDLVMVVTGLDRDFSLRRIERFLALARSGSVRAIVVLSKSDLADHLMEDVRQAERAAAGLTVVAASSITGHGVARIRDEIGPGRSAVLVGSSGAGKSTLINRLLGEDHQQTGAVRESDDRGRHVTTRRELLRLPGGGLVIDTPGLRQVGILADETSLLAVFPEIAAVSGQCRFNDCLHLEEPDCVVQEAVRLGDIDVGRLAAYHRLAREQENALRRSSEHQRRAHERSTIGHYRKRMREAHRLKGRED
jgi:ribosome biogenesis GTPase